MKYILKKLWFLILLLIVSIVVVVCGLKSLFCYTFLQQYMIFAIYVIAVGVLAHFFGEALPRKFRFREAPFAPLPFEDGGRFYQKKLKINKWKDHVMDISKAELGGSLSVESKAIGGEANEENIGRAIQESCVAEVTHAVLILLSVSLFFLLKMPYSVIFFILYFIMNLIDIIIQRCNRPRLVRLLDRLGKRK